MAIPLPNGGYTLPGQAVAVFVDSPWDELNRPHRMVMELLDDDGTLAQLSALIGPQSARFEHEVTIPQPVGAPNGTPGRATWLLDFPSGTLVIARARCRYVWRVQVGNAVGEAGFWVQSPPSEPIIGPPPVSPAP
jgi:hypothetical protein